MRMSTIVSPDRDAPPADAPPPDDTPRADLPPPPPPPVRLPQPLAEVPAASASAFVLELLWAAVRDRVDPAHVAAALTAVPPTLASAASRLADAVWLVWLELDHASSGGEEDATSEDLRRKLVALTRALLAPPGVAAPTPSAPLTRALLLERCEGDFLESCGCVASAARFKKREVRFNTKRVYVQRKFNLLREESEGYAKLIAALAAIREGPEPPPPPEEDDDSAAEDADGKDADERLSRVALRDSARAETLELIGAFDLDPNRALALILEALELAPTHRGLRDLLERFDREHVGQVLGFAFQRAAELSRADAAASSSRGGGGVRTSFVRESEAGDPADDRGVVSEEEAEEEEEEEAEEGEAPPIAPEATPAASDEPAAASELSATPESLFALAAILARDGVVDASALYAHLSPPDDVARRRFVAATEARLAAARRVGVVSLVSGASGASDETTDPASIAATPTDGSWGGQKLGFLRAALEVGDEATGASVHARLVALGADPAEDPRVRDALLASARRALEAPYEALASPPGCRAAMRKRAAGKKADGGAPTDDGGAPPTDDFSDSAVDALFARLAALGPHLGRDVDAFVRSCRVVRAVLDRANHRNGEADGDGDEDGDGDLSDEDDPPSSDDRRKHGSRKRVRVRDWRLACERILATAILPALSLVEANPAAANEAWAALSLMPTEARYRVYAEWRSWYNGCEDTFALEDDDWKRPPEAPEDDASDRAPGDSAASASASASTFAPAAPGPLTLPRPALVASSRVSIVATRRVLRRLSKDNAKPFGRALGKACHANPIPALSAVVSQIEAYTNMIEPVCASFAFLTRLGYDALTFVIVEKLAGGRAKLKSDGQHVSLWLQALASFCGHLARRYQDVDLASLLQYLANALKDDQSVDLLVLKELIARMTGCEALEDMSDAQIEAMAGGETLRAEAVVGAKGSVTTRQRLKGVARLRHALTRGPDPLAAPLLVLIAQRRQALAYEDDGGDDDFGGPRGGGGGGGGVGFGARRHLKLTSQLYDSCQETLFHYCDFLAAAYPDPREYAAMLPSLRELVHDHGIEPGIAFHVWRPVLRHLEPRARAEEDDAEEEKEEEKVAKVAGEDEGDDGTQKKDSVRTQKKKDEKDSNSDPNNPPTSSLPDSNSNSPLLGLGLTWGELDDAARSMLPDDAWEAITPELYVTFWAGSLYDLDVPTARYDAETNACEAKIKALNQSEDAADGGGGSRGGGRGTRPKDASSSAAIAASAKERKRERERLEGTLARLVAERDAQTSWTAKQSASLSAAKSRFFADPSPGQNVVIEKLLQHCVFPRLAHSPAEATFCARFFERLHAMDVPGFNTVLYLNQTFSPSLDRLIFTRTEYEANRLGRFLGDTLRLMERWRSDAAAYARECAGKEGFKAKQGTRDVTMDEFTQLAYKFHCRLSKAFMKCLEEEEYMAIRNVLAVGAKIVEHFPAVSRLGAHIMKRVDAVKTKDARGDIKTVATRYLAMLARKKKGWISDHAFNPIGCPPSEAEREAKEAERREEREREERKRKRLEREEQARKEREEREKSAGRGGGRRGGNKTGAAAEEKKKEPGTDGARADRGTTAGGSERDRSKANPPPPSSRDEAATKRTKLSAEAEAFTPTRGKGRRDEGTAAKGGGGGGEKTRASDDDKKNGDDKSGRGGQSGGGRKTAAARRDESPPRGGSRARDFESPSRERGGSRGRDRGRDRDAGGRDRGGEKRRRDDRGEDDRGDGGRDDAKRRRGEGTGGGGGGGGANDSPAVGRGGTRVRVVAPSARARDASRDRAGGGGWGGRRGGGERGGGERGGGERGGGGGDRDRDRNVRGGGDERGGDRDRNVRGGGERAGGGGGRGARGRR